MPVAGRRRRGRRGLPSGRGHGERKLCRMVLQLRFDELISVLRWKVAARM